MKKNNEKLNISQVSAILGISAATVRNWVRVGYLLPCEPSSPYFYKEDVLSLASQLAGDTNKKLRSRANKMALRKNFIPVEYSASGELRSNAEKIASEYIKTELPIEAVIFLAALKILVLNNEVKEFSSIKPIMNFDKLNWRRKAFKELMEDWYNCVRSDLVNDDERYIKIFFDCFCPVPNEDCLGFLYQSLKCSSDKLKKGSYYTPRNVTDDAFHGANGCFEKFLDPCCGTGNFLLSAAKIKNISFKNIYGIDCDHIAVRISAFNLLMHFNFEDSMPNVICADALNNISFKGGNTKKSEWRDFDLIATNPPWGAKFPGLNRKKTLKETFSLFIEKSFKFAKKGGVLSFVLPESVLNVRKHRHIRHFILKKTKIIKIIKLGRIFTGVFTPVIRLDIQKGVCCKDNEVFVEAGSETYTVLQNRFLRNNDYIFDTNTNSAEEKIIEKIYSKKHLTLKGYADWALGIVTGNNTEYLKSGSNNGLEAVFRGADIEAFRFKKNIYTIKFNPEKFQQCALEKYYRADEKLVYKFISNKLVFAYDNSGALTLNSANIVIPKLPGYTIRAVLGFMNSIVFRFLFSKKFMTHKILRNDLEQLPFPVLKKEVIQHIDAETNRIINGETNQERLDTIIFDVFELSAAEIEIIKNNK